ncbi:MAG: hypothetical protein IRZ04_04415 [Rhodospirillales bacterium]|nr:hypothetical protein [Rhodospirillales bacterium]
MRALKVLVVVMGVMLIGGLVVLVATIVSRAGMRPPAAAEKPGFGTRVVDLPPGAVLAGRDVVGDRLVLTIALADGNHRLLVFEPGSGTVLGSLELRAQ